MQADTQALPDWVRNNPGKHLRRLQFEASELHKNFPNLGFFRSGNTLYIEGQVLSMSLNAYRIRVVYGSDYPYAPPSAYVEDRDVVDYCSAPGNQGHAYHNYGATEWGLKLCLLDKSEWHPVKSAISVVEYALAWINAYEFKRIRGYWPLKEIKQ